MNGKTMLLLVLVALGGIILGAVGMQYFGSWEGVAQALGALRQPGNPTPVATRAAAEPPTDQAEHDAHEGHTHEEHTRAGAAPHAHSHDEPGPAATTGTAPSKADTHSTAQRRLPLQQPGVLAHPRQTHMDTRKIHTRMAQSSRVRPMPRVLHAAKTDTHGHGAETPTAMRKRRWCVCPQTRHSNSVLRWRWRARGVCRRPSPCPAPLR